MTSNNIKSNFHELMRVARRGSRRQWKRNTNDCYIIKVGVIHCLLSRNSLVGIVFNHLTEQVIALLVNLNANGQHLGFPFWK